jgi:DNA-binding protein YbaB
MSMPSAAGEMPWGDPESSIARVREQMAETLARAERAQQLKGAIDSIRVTTASPHREVEVVVDATGRLVDIVFSEGASDLPPRDLARLVLAAAARAQRTAGEQAVGLTAEIFGEDSETVALLRGEVEQRMPPESDVEGIGYR